MTAKCCFSWLLRKIHWYQTPLFSHQIKHWVGDLCIERHIKIVENSFKFIVISWINRWLSAFCQFCYKLCLDQTSWRTASFWKIKIAVEFSNQEINKIIISPTHFMYTRIKHVRMLKYASVKWEKIRICLLGLILIQHCAACSALQHSRKVRSQGQKQQNSAGN